MSHILGGSISHQVCNHQPGTWPCSGSVLTYLRSQRWGGFHEATYAVLSTVPALNKHKCLLLLKRVKYISFGFWDCGLKGISLDPCLLKLSKENTTRTVGIDWSTVKMAILTTALWLIWLSVATLWKSMSLS